MTYLLDTNVLSETRKRQPAAGVAEWIAATPPDRLGVAGWMIQGVAQAGLFGLLALLQWVVRAPNRAFVLDRAARGLGKTFWWSPFKVQLYGLPTSV